MAIISQDKFVCVEYRLKLASGEYIRGSAEKPDRLVFVAGCGEVLPGLERRLWGLSTEQGPVEFVVPCEEAFGAYDPDNVQVWSRKRFSPDIDLKVGQKVLPSVLPFPPEHPLVIKEVREDSVVLDLNHPLADQDLYYEVKVLEVRDMAPEELAVLKQCQSCRDEMQ
jgi:FKBP-type peptidyl-prolyl cis-trans isomerase 2|uniref:FKBP-type peptidyl-prolyl cis-trans isomerase SlyD n=1 Tax=Desulfobacca acetoxidans TaxID=60893 RepID=A0A7C3V3M0_9BACT